MTKRSLSDSALRQVRQLWAAGTLTRPQLAERFGVSDSAIKRAVKGIHKGSGVAVGTALVALPESSSSPPPIKDDDLTPCEVVDYGELQPELFAQTMRSHLGILAHQIESGTLKRGSMPETARAFTQMLTTYREMYPVTMEEAADWVMSLPGFDPLKFAQILRDRAQMSA